MISVDDVFFRKLIGRTPSVKLSHVKGNVLLKLEGSNVEGP